MSLPAPVDWQGYFVGASAAESIATMLAKSRFGNLFPASEVGSVPFGNLCGMDVFVAELLRDEGIAFNAGSHTELVRLRYKDFERLVRPKIADFAVAG